MHVFTMQGSAKGLWPILFVAVVAFVVVIIVVVVVAVIDKGGHAHGNIPLVRGCWLL
jgi:hypothetical protein